MKKISIVLTLLLLNGSFSLHAQQGKSAIQDSLAMPSAAALGIPLYPGSVYDPKMSFSLGENFFSYIFYSPDTAVKVADYYQKHFRKEPMKATSGYGTPSYNFQQILAKYPDDFVSVLTDPKERRTVIMVVRTGKD